MRLSPQQIDAFLDERHTLVLATLRRDESVHLSTVWYRWDGRAFWISTNRDRAKYRNIERNSRVSVLVDDPPKETSVSARGRAEPVASDEDAYEGALAIVRRYVDDPVAYLAERAGEPRVLLRIEPEKITSWAVESRLGGQ
jgi:PPOX class probable F420-dependent enzyme